MQSGHQTIMLYMHHLYPERLTKLHLLYLSFGGWEEVAVKKKTHSRTPAAGFEPGTSDWKCYV